MTEKVDLIPPLNKRQAAALRGVSLRQFSTIVREDSSVPRMANGAGKADEYDPRAFGDWLRAQVVDDALDDIDGIDPAEVAKGAALEQIGKGRKFMAEAGIKENDLKVRQGKFGEIEVMTRVMGLIGKQVRTIMESLPSRLVAKYEWLDAEQIDFIKFEISETMNDIAQLDEDWVVLASRTDEE